jgi:phosphohistidine phosphatase SixA
VGAALAKLLPLVNGIRHTYRDRNELRTQMFEPLWTLSDVYNQLNQPEKALEAIKEIFDSLEPQLIYSHVPMLHARMAEVIVFQNKNKFIKNAILLF